MLAWGQGSSRVGSGDHQALDWGPGGQTGTKPISGSAVGPPTIPGVWNCPSLRLGMSWSQMDLQHLQTPGGRRQESQGHKLSHNKHGRSTCREKPPCARPGRDDRPQDAGQFQRLDRLPETKTAA